MSAFKFLRSSPEDQLRCRQRNGGRPFASPSATDSSSRRPGSCRRRLLRFHALKPSTSRSATFGSTPFGFSFLWRRPSPSRYQQRSDQCPNDLVTSEPFGGKVVRPIHLGSEYVPVHVDLITVHHIVTFGVPRFLGSVSVGSRLIIIQQPITVRSSSLASSLASRRWSSAPATLYLPLFGGGGGVCRLRRCGRGPGRRRSRSGRRPPNACSEPLLSDRQLAVRGLLRLHRPDRSSLRCQTTAPTVPPVARTSAWRHSRIGGGFSLRRPPSTSLIRSTSRHACVEREAATNSPSPSRLGDIQRSTTSSQQRRAPAVESTTPDNAGSITAPPLRGGTTTPVPVT